MKELLRQRKTHHTEDLKEDRVSHMVGNDYKLKEKKQRRRREGEGEEEEERNRRQQRGDEVNKRLNNTHQGLINCCSMGATS